MALIPFWLLALLGTPLGSSLAAFSQVALSKEDYSTTEEAHAAFGAIRTGQASERRALDIQGGCQTSPVSSTSISSSVTRYVMCKGHDVYYNPIDPTTIFRPSDAKAECLTTVFINDSIEFRWSYRSNTTKTWVPCYNWSERALSGGEYHYAGYLLIAGYWPGSYFPRGYRVDVYLDGFLGFSDFFEVTNGGLNGPRMSESVDSNGRPVNAKSRFTIGVDPKIFNWLSFYNVAYFNEKFECCHNFTTVWIQPNGSAYKRFSSRFSDYKDTNMSWNCWKYGYVMDDYITVNSSIPVGEWKVLVYIDSYVLNGTLMPYGPLATTPFIVGSEPVADWTFMAYLDGDNGLESAALTTFANMASVNSSSQVNVVAQFDRIAGIDSGYGNWTGCYRFCITKGITPVPENATLDLGEVNMGNPEVLRDFANWTMTNYPANHFFLVLWDHGAGFMGYCFDETSQSDSLSLSELSQALTGLQANVDAIFIDACSASMIEVAYQIKDCANILIGPEDLGYEPAPYHDYLSSLVANPLIQPDAFAEEVVNDYASWCWSALNISNATMSAVDLTEIMGLSAAIDDYALELNEKETPFHEQINLARNLTEGCQGPFARQTGNYVDLYDFARLTQEYIPNVELQNSAGRLMTALSPGNAIIVEVDKARPNCHGLSIFFPANKENYTVHESVYEATDFAIDNLWSKFIENDLSGHILTIQTFQPGIPVEIDEDSFTTDEYGKVCMFCLPTYHTVNVTYCISTGPGARALFTRWNDSDVSNPKTLFLDRSLTLRAEYEAQYRLVMSGNYGGTNPSIGEHWCKAYSNVNIDVTPPVASSGEQFLFVSWTGKGNGSYSGPTNSVSIAINEPINETAVWNHQYYLTVTSAYGSPGPASRWCDAGETVTASVTSPIPGTTGTQYMCEGWTGTGSVSVGGAASSVNFTVDQASSLTWIWKTQHHVTVEADPAGLDPSPTLSSPGPWYNEGTLLVCVAQNVSGKAFDHWTVKGLATGHTSQWERGVMRMTMTIDEPYEAIAHYEPIAVWWQDLLQPQNLPMVLGLSGGTVTLACVGVAWIITRRRKRAQERPGRAFAEKVSRVVLPGRITTGYADLDGLLLGGIPESLAVALTSVSCDERDALISRFLDSGIKRGETALYIALDVEEVKALVEGYQSSFYLLVCSPRADAMIEDLPNVFKLKGVENLTEINIALTKVFQAMDSAPKGPRRACIDIVSDVLLQHHPVVTRRWLADLLPDLKSRGFTSLATLNPQMHPPEEVQAILGLFEGEISIYERETETALRFLKIKRMSNQKYLDSELLLQKAKL